LKGKILQVVGADRKQVANTARSIDRMDKRENREREDNGKSGYEYDLDAWENYGWGKLNPEISERGKQDTHDGKGRGIAIDTNDFFVKDPQSKSFWTALTTIHGAGHNSSLIGHTEKGVMADGNGLARQWSRSGSSEILNKANNEKFVAEMLRRFSSEKPVDNYGKNKR
jgi:hypothetical protein